MFDIQKIRVFFILTVVGFVFLAAGCIGPFAPRRPRWESRYASPVPEATDIDARELKREEKDLKADKNPDSEPREKRNFAPANFKNQVAAAYRRGDYERAIDLLEKRLEKNSDQPAVLFNLGSLHYRLENFREARNYYRRAVELKPDDVQGRKYLGASYYQLGEWDMAIQEFERVLELDPRQEEVRGWLKQLR
ncbi:MAG: tetratricopeptide repeat protein [bacterium]